MRNMPAIMVGAVGAAFLVASLVSDLTEAHPSYPALDAVAVKAKTISPTTPLIRSGFDGQILFGTDSVVNTNYLSIRMNEPVAALKDERKDPALEPGIRRHESRDEPQKEKKRRPQVFGCMTSVSPLAQASADQHPSLCLAQRAHGRSLG
jgi:hypothetical protein